MKAEIEKLITFETDIDYNLTPGFIVGLVDGPNVNVFSFGTRALDTDDTIRIDDVFEIGSVTKVFTASLFAEMQRNERLQMDMKVNDCLPFEYQNPNMSDVTILDLLTHKSTLPRSPVFNENVESPMKEYPTYTLDELLLLYQNFQPKLDQKTIYSNVSYALLEPILCGLTDSIYEELLVTHLVNALELSSTSIDPSTVTVQGYNHAVEPTPAIDFGVFNTSGGLKSSMSDMLKFLNYSLYQSPDLIWEEYNEGLSKHLDIGLGWHIVHPRKSNSVFVHTGISLGHTAFIGLVRNTNTGVVILSNSANGVDDLGLELLRIMNKNWKRKQ